MTKETITKNVYVEVPKELWAKVKMICFNRSITLKQFVTELLEKELKRK